MRSSSNRIIQDITRLRQRHSILINRNQSFISSSRRVEPQHSVSSTRITNPMSITTTTNLHHQDYSNDSFISQHPESLAHPQHPTSHQNTSIMLLPTQINPIKLNQVETKLIHLLNECTTHFNNQFNSKLESDQHQIKHNINPHQLEASHQSLELRIAGGWVRDKLLGVETHDLDIGVSSLTGLEFANLFANFINSRKNEDDQEQIMGKISTIEARPDQSKHLETATTNFLGLDLDFVQLRSEDYGHENHSRIPNTVNFGTPLEDALRRDITINSLFYNIHTGLIEDHTEKGLKDLENGLIRTPLPASQTFQDDPLRLLRCIRFATRLKFRLDEDIILAAKSESIQNAFMDKVSRERVGIEVDKMMKGPDPLSSLKTIVQLGLYELVFKPPKEIENDAINPSLAIQAANWLHFFIHQNQEDTPSISPSIQKILPPLHPKLIHLFSPSSPLVRRLFLACGLLPYRPFIINSKKKQRWAPEMVLMDSLKLGNHDKTFISHLFNSLELINVEKFRSILSLESSNLRLELGRILRSPHVHDLKIIEENSSLVWQASFLFGLVHEFACLESDQIGSSFSHDIIVEKFVKILDNFNSIIHLIYELDLTFVLTTEFEKKRLDGKEICQILGIRPGKHIAKIIESLIDQQIQFPKLSKQDATIWLNNQVKMGLISTISN